MYTKYGKRLLDLLLAALSLALLWLPMVLLALAIRLDSPGPILFQQTRIGRNQVPFTLYKFRSMKPDAPSDVPAHLLTHPEQHLTRLGRFLRRTGLDELPQLWNILRGDMSFVGPRPALWNQTDLTRQRQQWDASHLRPGLTGWAQINGRNALTVPQKARLDGEYAQKCSLFFDLKCFFGTFGCLLREEKRHV